jgi:hypothetical protein
MSDGFFTLLFVYATRTLLLSRGFKNFKDYKKQMSPGKLLVAMIREIDYVWLGLAWGFFATPQGVP